MIDRLQRVLDNLGYPLGSDELLDVLLLARVMDESRTRDEGALSPDPATGADTAHPVEDTAEDDSDEQSLDAEDVKAAPTKPDEEQAARQRRFLFPGRGGTGSGADTRARAVRLPAPRALSGAHSLARSLRPLRGHRDHPHRNVVDVEATLRLTAESGTLDVVLRPERELLHSAILLVDDSPSMRVWRSLVPEVSGLLVRSGNFRTVRTGTFSPQKPHLPRRWNIDAASVVFLLTDGVHPAWTNAAIAEAVAGWGARGPVAAINPLPRRLWRATHFPAQPQMVRAARRFPAAHQLVMLDPLTGERAEYAGGTGPTLPVLALSPASMASWTQLLTGPAVPRLIEAATLESLDVEETRAVSAAPVAEPPERLIEVFRGSFSPEAYRLAVRLSTLELPLSPLLIQIVRSATLPEATSAHVVEVLLGGLLEGIDDERALEGTPESLRKDGLYAFRPGVRGLLSSALSLARAQEVTRAVGRALEPYLDRLPDFSALVTDASGTIRLPDGASPFAVMDGPAEREDPDGEQTSGTGVPAEAWKTSEALGGALLRASAGSVAAALRNGSLVTLLIDSYTQTVGHRPPPSQVRAWERSLPALAGCLVDAGLTEVEMLVEFALPMNSGRLDVILAGPNPLRSAPSYVIVELKEWTSAVRDGTDSGLCSADGGTALALDPVDQVQLYRDYLVRFNSVLADHPERVDVAVYLPNATEFGVHGLRDDGGLLQEDRLFTGESRRELIAYLRSRFGGGRPGAEAADALLLGTVLSPQRLTALAAQEVRTRGQFTLLDEQEIAARTVLAAVRQAERSAGKEVVIVTGGAGTGKSVIALHLLGKLRRQGKAALHATGSQALTKTLRRVVGGRRRTADELFRYFNSFMEAQENSLDVLICDEAHRIRRTSANRYTKAALTTGRPQIDELIDAARVSVFLLDEGQVVRPGEIGSVAGIARAAQDKGVPVQVVSLDSQFRCGGSDAYMHWTARLAGLEPGGPARWEPDGRMQLLVAGTPQDMEAFLEDQLTEGYAARMTAGYCWPWSADRGPGEPLPLDVVIGNWARAWNLRGDRSVSGAPPAALWATDPAGFGQVGCIYTAQGFEFDWSGVVIGPDLVWRGDRFITDRTASRDPSLRNATADEADRMIRNAYRVLLTRSTVGTVVYSTDAETRAKLRELGCLTLGAQHRLAEENDRLGTVRSDERTGRNTRKDSSPSVSAPETGWATCPALADLFPWGTPGMAAHRNWVVSPSREVLELRWNRLVGEGDPEVKASLFKPTRDSSTEKIHNALPGRAPHGVPLSREESGRPDVVRIGMRSFDRQWLIADERVIDRPRPGLWAALRQGQIFLNQPSASDPPRWSGPAVVATSLLPDMHHFAGRGGGRVHPVLQPDGDDNVAHQLLPFLSYLLRSRDIQATDLAAYVMAVAGHSGFTERFRDDLATPGVRIPLTRDPRLWEAGVRLGKEVLWASTYGDVCFDSASGRPHGSIAYEPGDKRQVRYLEPVGDGLPDDMRYDPLTGTVRVGPGVFGPVSGAVWSYEVGGVNVLRRWFGYRKGRPAGRRSSPLDDIHVTHWPTEWSVELIEVLTLLRRLTELADAQDGLLQSILAKPLVTETDLNEAGVFPVGARAKDRPQPG
ncbi:SAV_2336 N-terminal domain-related protein [Streptomyces sp. RPA4-2]|uniref:SAV_2336 N-terminal domain-related protein n=1 Tax=Streptomyces sp. RPA4-2 TaxID=2721244 RepID=UPI0032B4D6C4